MKKLVSTLLTYFLSTAVIWPGPALALNGCELKTICVDHDLPRIDYVTILKDHLKEIPDELKLAGAIIVWNSLVAKWDCNSLPLSE